MTQVSSSYFLASETVKHMPGQEVEAWSHYATVLQFTTYQRLNISCEGAFPQNMVGSSIMLATQSALWVNLHHSKEKVKPRWKDIKACPPN